MIQMKFAMHGWYKSNNIRIWHIGSHSLSPNMFVANIKLSFFLHVPISLKNISFNIVGHGMDLIVEVLSQCLQTLFWWWWGRWRSLWRTMGCWYVWTYDIVWYLPQCGKRKWSQPTFKFIHPHGKNVCSNGWHNAKNHQRSQRRWGSTHRPHHTIIVSYCNKCTRYSPFQCKWNHASRHGHLVHRMKDWHETML